MDFLLFVLAQKNKGRFGFCYSCSIWQNLYTHRHILVLLYLYISICWGFRQVSQTMLWGFKDRLKCPHFASKWVSGEQVQHTHTHTHAHTWSVIVSVDELLRARTALNSTECISQMENLFVFSPLRGGGWCGRRVDPHFQPLWNTAMCHPECWRSLSQQ